MKEELSATEQQIFEDFDGLIWGLVQEIKKEKVSNYVLKNAYKYKYKQAKKNIEKIEDLGYKYYVCMMKKDKPESIEVWSAILGDPNSWVDKIADLGYNGMMIKKDSLPKKEVKNLFKKMLLNFKFEEKVINVALKSL